MARLVIQARKANISSTMEVKRILPFRQKRMVGPFIFLDHAGPIKLANQNLSSLDVLPHPHIGLSTVTYLFGGAVLHRDSLNTEQLIEPGAVNWMTAGKGIAHSERFDNLNFTSDQDLEMIQSWIALPKEVEECAPTFVNYQPDALPIFTDKGIWMRLIAGEAYGLKSKVETHSPLFYLHVNLEKNTSFNLPRNYSERAIYIVKGSIAIGHQNFGIGQLLVFDKNEDPIIFAKTSAVIMLLGGEPLGERFIWWNFVSSSAERIEQAKNDWKQGRIILPPNDNKVFIPLPENNLKPASSITPPPPELLS